MTPTEQEKLDEETYSNCCGAGDIYDGNLDNNECVCAVCGEHCETKVLELFAGTKSFSNAAQSLGATVFTSDIDPEFNTDYAVSVMDFDVSKVPFRPDILWASPPCETFSVASLGHHWKGGMGSTP